MNDASEKTLSGRSYPPTERIWSLEKEVGRLASPSGLLSPSVAEEEEGAGSVPDAVVVAPSMVRLV